jgi:hypothetical protein
MRSAKELLHDTVDQLSEQEAQETLRLFEDIGSPVEPAQLARQLVSNAKKIVRLAALEASDIPSLTPARFEPFHAIAVPGIPASEMLIDDRR